MNAESILNTVPTGRKARPSSSKRAWSDGLPQGGVLTSDIAVERNADGRLEVFVRGTDNARLAQMADRAQQRCSGWASQGGVHHLKHRRRAQRRRPPRSVRARGTDNALWHKWQTAPSKRCPGWSSQGGVITSNIAIGTNADGRLEVFARGTDSALWHKWQVAPNGSWSGWASQGGVLTSNIAVARNADGRLEVFARGTDNALWHKWQWRQTARARAGRQRRRTDIRHRGWRNADGRLEVFVRGTDSAMWHKWQMAPNGAWSGWASQGGVLTSQHRNRTQSPSGRLEAFVRGTDNALWHKWQIAPNSACSDWASEGRHLTSNIAVGTNADGRLEVFVRGTDNALWHKWQVRVFAAVRQAVTRGTETSPRQMPSDHLDMELESRITGHAGSLTCLLNRAHNRKRATGGYMPKGEMRSAGNAGMPGKARCVRTEGPRRRDSACRRARCVRMCAAGCRREKCVRRGRPVLRAKSRTCRAHKGRARRVLMPTTHWRPTRRPARGEGDFQGICSSQQPHRAQTP